MMLLTVKTIDLPKLSNHGLLHLLLLQFMIYILYARRSCKEKSRQIRSIPDQLDWGHATAKQRDLTIAKVFTDTQSAKAPGRGGFNEMIQWIHKQTEPVGILSWKLSRLARNPIDEGTVKYGFIQGKIGHILAKDREFRTGDNQILMGVEFGAATQFSIELSTDVRRGLDAKVNSGWKPGLAPLGYVNDPVGLKGEKQIFADPERFDQIQDMWRMLLTGAYTVPHIQRIANEEWGFRTRSRQKLANSTLYTLFTKPFYAGMYLWNGVLRKGAHPPMISWSEFEAAQIILGSRGKPIQSKHRHLYTGLIRCGECGCMVTAEPPKKKVHPKTGTIRVYQYLRCTKKHHTHKCSQKYLRVEEAETQMIDLLNSVQISPEFVEWALKELAHETGAINRRESRRKRDVTVHLKETDTLLDALTDKFLKGSISEAAYQRQYSRYQQEHARLEEQIGTPAQRRKPSLKNNFSCWQSLVPSFKSGTREEKHELFQQVGSNLRMIDKTLHLDWAEPFATFKNAVTREREILDRLEPEQRGINMLSEKDLRGLIPVWSGALSAARNFFDKKTHSFGSESLPVK